MEAPLPYFAVTAEVAVFVSKYREMNETSDVLRSLERIGEDSRELFRLGLPAGKLLATYNATGKVIGLHIGRLAPSSPTFGWVTKYWQRVNGRFKKIFSKEIWKFFFSFQVTDEEKTALTELHKLFNCSFGEYSTILFTCHASTVLGVFAVPFQNIHLRYLCMLFKKPLQICR